MRQLLNITLFLNIMVDTGSRGGDIAWDRKTPVDTCLLWEDIKLCAFWNAEMDAVDIRANLTFRHLKGMKLEPSHYKTVPFSLPNRHGQGRHLTLDSCHGIDGRRL